MLLQFMLVLFALSWEVSFVWKETLQVMYIHIK